MLNDAQMAKLRKRVSKEVTIKMEKKDEEYNAKKDTIARRIKMVEAENPNRGKCQCIWGGLVYFERENKLQACPWICSKDIRKSMQLVEMVGKGSPDEQSYYMYSEESYKEMNDISEWMKENYAFIKMYQAGATNENTSKKRLNSVLGLSGVFEKFQEKFPDKSMLDFIEWFKAFDDFAKIMLNDISKG